MQMDIMVLSMHKDLVSFTVGGEQAADTCRSRDAKLNVCRRRDRLKLNASATRVSQPESKLYAKFRSTGSCCLHGLIEQRRGALPHLLLVVEGSVFWIGEAFRPMNLHEKYNLL